MRKQLDLLGRGGCPMMGVVEEHAEAEFVAQIEQQMRKLRRIPFVDNHNVDVAQLLAPGARVRQRRRGGRSRCSGRDRCAANCASERVPSGLPRRLRTDHSSSGSKADDLVPELRQVRAEVRAGSERCRCSSLTVAYARSRRFANYAAWTPPVSAAAFERSRLSKTAR